LSAHGPDWKGHSYVYATELTTGVIGYSHPPRSIYLTFFQGTGDTLTLEETPPDQLSQGHATLRVTQHSQVPRLYIVERGTVQVVEERSGGPFGSYVVIIEGRLVDPLDGDARIQLNVSFRAPIEVIS